jgi:hypothetical protein
MSDKNKAALPGSQTTITKHTDSIQNNPSTASGKPPTQLERVLLALLYHGSLNCQEAEQLPVKARHLNSVVSELTHSHGLNIHRQSEKTRGYLGESCRFVRYSVYPHQQTIARQLVDQWRAKRSAAPIAWKTLQSASLEKLLRTA